MSKALCLKHYNQQRNYIHPTTKKPCYICSQEQRIEVMRSALLHAEEYLDASKYASNEKWGKTALEHVREALEPTDET